MNFTNIKQVLSSSLTIKLILAERNLFLSGLYRSSDMWTKQAHKHTDNWQLILTVRQSMKPQGEAMYI